ncbi:hypothetical protein V5N11_010422 [Cardamine amara subsp. amara]|uniref:Transposase MuDR plant domain-containing protein n=1 Tax=Cardamine amara subsp. amara TaxID=228776 RepID=A0ABD0ZIM1_CARAN
MECIIIVSGKGMFANNRWLLVVDSKSGSRILQGNTKTTYDEFIDMVYEDYGLDKRVCNVELSYMLPKNLLHNLPLETLPVIIGNCRQFQFYLAQSSSEKVRICVEVKEKMLPESKEVDGDDCMTFNDSSENSENEEDEDESRFDYCDDSDGTNSDDENFSKYEMPLEEKEVNTNVPTKKSKSTLFLPQPNEYHDFVNFELSSMTLAVGKYYASKEHLETRLKILTVIEKFDFRVDYTKQDLLIVRCWVEGCTWRLRASPTENDLKFHVRVYIAEHKCSVTKRYASSRQATLDILRLLCMDFVCGIGPSVRPIGCIDRVGR